jgi:hypothetical protein
MRGRKFIGTRQDIVDHFDKRMVEKGLDHGGVKKGGKLFAWYMGFPVGQRPTVNGLAEMYHMERHQMRKYIERWDADKS